MESWLSIESTKYRDVTVGIQLIFELLKIVVTYIIVAAITRYQIGRSDRAMLNQIAIDLAKERVRSLSELLAKATKVETLVRWIDDSRAIPLVPGQHQYSVGLPWFRTKRELPPDIEHQLEHGIEEMVAAAESYGDVPPNVILGDPNWSTPNLGMAVSRWGIQTRGLLFNAGSFVQVWPPIEDPKVLSGHAVSGVLELMGDIRRLIELEKDLLTRHNRVPPKSSAMQTLGIIENPWYLSRVSGHEQVDIRRITLKNDGQGNIVIGYQTPEEHELELAHQRSLVPKKEEK